MSWRSSRTLPFLILACTSFADQHMYRGKAATPYLLVVAVLLLGVIAAVLSWQLMEHNQTVLYHKTVQDLCNDASISLRKQVVSTKRLSYDHALHVPLVF